jgi:hypothetical protein
VKLVTSKNYLTRLADTRIVNNEVFVKPAKKGGGQYE